MKVFDLMEGHGHEQLVFCCDRESGLKAVIAIHDTALGPALGGCRMWPYEKEEDAVVDVLRLARAMTYKNSIMGLSLGGGKCVVIGNPRRDKSEALFRALGRFVQSLGGRYITAEDVGTGVEDIALVAQETEYVAGQEGVAGDPSPVTAFGVYRGMKACAREVFGSDSLRGRRVAVQGLGHVGTHLCRHLKDDGAELIVTDIFPDNVERIVQECGARAVRPEEVYNQACDIFSPCALGAVLNDDTIPRLRCRIVAGAANNQLAEPRHGQMLQAKGVLYAPDYVINGGGVINVAAEFARGGYRREQVYARVATIYDKLQQIFATARQAGIRPEEAADRLAEERIARIGRLRCIYVPE